MLVSILAEVHPLTFDVLRLLCAQEFRSGQALAARLAVSRASVWGALNEAEAAGIAIQRVHGRGYRLGAPLDWLDADRIARAIAGTGLALEIVDCCESTNASLLERADRGAAGGMVLAAELQTRGRGRLGRTWQSGLASALTFSVLWRFRLGIASLAGLSLAVGTVIARVLRREGVAAQLKWPNDIVWRARKLGGVLIEVRGDALGPCAAVIGVGLNVRLGEAERSRVDQPAADLADAGAPRVVRSEWLATILGELAPALSGFDATGFEPWREEWRRYSAHDDKRIRLALPDGRHLDGVARGVDGQGRLLVESAGRRSAYASAEVSLRALDDPRD